MLKREFKINLKSLIVWASIIVGMLIIVFSIYPSIVNSESYKEIDKMMDMFPPEVLKAFNMDMVSISSVFGWIKTEGYVFICLLGSIYSSMLGINILSCEERDKTIEFLISKPITRNKIITNKIICGVTYIFIFNLTIFLTNMCGLLLSNDMIWDEFILISVAPLILYYMMFFLSLLISVIYKKPKKLLGISLLLVFIPYVFQLLGSISDKISILKTISLFEFVSIRYIISNLHINYIYLGVSIIIIVTSIIFSYKEYNDKELV